MISTDDFKAIAALDLDPIKVKLMHEESGEGWSLEKANAVEFEYRRFLVLMKKFPQEQTAPLFDVDIFWHYHILDTMKYARDCEDVFGYFLHHFPYIGLRGEADEQAHHRVGERMRELYEETFGEAYVRAAPQQSAFSGATAAAAFSGAPAAATSSTGVHAHTAFSGAPGKTAFSGAPHVQTAFSGAPGKTAFSGAPHVQTAFSGAPGKTAFSGAPHAQTAFSGAPRMSASSDGVNAQTAFSGAPGKTAFSGAPHAQTAFSGAPKTAFSGAQVGKPEQVGAFYSERPSLAERA
jgi:hypothetical protein